jgi:YidC/Oxa1 family membrane protein insertase
MRVIKPEMDALNEKYPRQEDAMKKQQAMMNLYKKAGVNPMGGCLPMLIQLPLLWALFRFFPVSIELRGQSFLWADDLSSYDSILQLPFSIPWYGDHVSLFALLMCVAMVGFSYFTYQQQGTANQPGMAGMKFMMVYMMPAMMLFWFNDYASGLCYYYLVSQILTMIIMTSMRRFVDDDKIRYMMEKNSSKYKNKKKSKFQLRYEELMRQQEELARQQQKNAKRR